MNKEGKGAGGTKFYPNFANGCALLLRKRFSFCDMQRFLTFMWLFSVTLLPQG